MHSRHGVPPEGEGPPSQPVGEPRKDPRDFGTDCAHCPFAKDGAPNQPVFGEGPDDAIGIVIGEGPGRDEAASGRPFVGMTGQQLDTELLSVGLRRSRLFLVNATCCQPAPGAKAAMMQTAAKCCRPAFVAQVARFPLSTPMFAMGRWAAYAVLGNAKKIMKTRGFIRPVFVPKFFKTEEQSIVYEGRSKGDPRKASNKGRAKKAKR